MVYNWAPPNQAQLYFCKATQSYVYTYCKREQQFTVMLAQFGACTDSVHQALFSHPHKRKEPRTRLTCTWDHSCIIQFLFCSSSAMFLKWVDDTHALAIYKNASDGKCHDLYTNSLCFASV